MTRAEKILVDRTCRSTFAEIQAWIAAGNDQILEGKRAARMDGDRIACVACTYRIEPGVLTCPVCELEYERKYNDKIFVKP